MTASQLAACLRTGSAQDTAGVDVEALVTSATRHNVAALVYVALRGGRSAAVDRLGRIAREHALMESVQRADAIRVIEALGAAGISALLFKGTALAYSLYEEPWLRPRADTDLLVQEADAARTAEILDGIGYARVPRPEGQYVTHQFTYVGTADGIATAYDIHWRIADPQVFARALTFEGLQARSVAVPALGTGARRVSDVDALVIACVHRVAHHYDDDQLIRTVDIDRLSRRLTSGDWDLFVEIATTACIRAVCGRGIALSQDMFETPVPDSVVRALESADGEPSATYLRPGLRKIDILYSDLRALTNTAARVRLVREHLFPPLTVVSADSTNSARKFLKIGYLWRIIHGASGWFKPLRPPEKT